MIFSSYYIVLLDECFTLCSSYGWLWGSIACDICYHLISQLLTFTVDHVDILYTGYNFNFKFLGGTILCGFLFHNHWFLFLPRSSFNHSQAHKKVVEFPVGVHLNTICEALTGLCSSCVSVVLHKIIMTRADTSQIWSIRNYIKNIHFRTKKQKC